MSVTSATVPDMHYGKPSYEWGQSPKHLLTADQLHNMLAMRPRQYSEPDAYVLWGNRNEPSYAALYDVREGVPM